MTTCWSGADTLTDCHILCHTARMVVAQEVLKATPPSDPRVRRLAAALTRHHKRWKKAQPLVGGKPAGWRPLAEQVAQLLPDSRGVSHETMRRLHKGDIEWRNIHAPTIAALAHIYGVKMADLSPNHAQNLSDLGLLTSGWVTAAEVEVEAAAA